MKRRPALDPTPIATIARAVKAGTITTYDTLDGFSHTLCQTYLRDPEAWELARNSLNQKLLKSYRPTFDAWLKTIAPRGLLVARGMHNIPMSNAAGILRAIRSREDTESYSMNLAQAACSFAIPTEDSVGVGGTVTVARLHREDLDGFGGDSESGDLQEAEVHARRFPFERTECVFALSPRPIRGARLCSLQERREYALTEAISIHAEDDSSSTGFIELLLHPSVTSMIPKRYKQRKIHGAVSAQRWRAAFYGVHRRKAIRSLTTAKWYVIYQAPDRR